MTGSVSTLPQFRVPDDLVEVDQWVLWRHESRTKIPYTTAGRRASSTDPATWCSYEEARAAWYLNATAEESSVCDLHREGALRQQRVGAARHLVEDLHIENQLKFGVHLDTEVAKQNAKEIFSECPLQGKAKGGNVLFEVLAVDERPYVLAFPSDQQRQLYAVRKPSEGR